MARKRSPTNRDTEPPRIDDLKLINGIGPSVEKQLNGVGVFTFVQLAALSSADIAAAVADLTGLSAGRIIKQDWIGQARKLVAESLVSEAQQDVGAPKEEPAPAAAHQVESQELPQPTSESLLSSVPNDIEVPAVAEQPVTPTAPIEPPAAASKEDTQETILSAEPEEVAMPFIPPTAADEESAGLSVPSDESAFPNAEAPDHTPAVATESEPLAPITASSHLAGTLHVRAMEMIGSKPGGLHRILAHGEPFDIRLTLDLTDLQVPGNTPLNYKASIYAKGKVMGSHSGLVVGEAQGTIIPADTVTIKVEGNTLPEEGIYRLAAT